MDLTGTWIEAALKVPEPGWMKRCGCGHLMLRHDVEDMDGSNPSCCVEGCDQVCDNGGVYAIESTAHAELDYEEPSDYMVELELVDQLHDDRGAGQGVAVRRESRFASRGFFRRRALSDTPPCPISLSPIPIRADGGR